MSGCWSNPTIIFFPVGFEMPSSLEKDRCMENNHFLCCRESNFFFSNNFFSIDFKSEQISNDVLFFEPDAGVTRINRSKVIRFSWWRKQTTNWRRWWSPVYTEKDLSSRIYLVKRRLCKIHAVITFFFCNRTSRSRLSPRIPWQYSCGHSTAISILRFQITLFLILSFIAIWYFWSRVSHIVIYGNLFLFDLEFFRSISIVFFIRCRIFWFF